MQSLFLRLVVYDIMKACTVYATLTPIFPVQEEAESVQQETKGGTLQDMEDALAAKTQAADELKQELEEIRATFGTEGIQQVSVVLQHYMVVWLLLHMKASSI